MRSRILVAHSNAKALDQCCRILEENRHSTNRVTTGLECLHCMSSANYDLLVINDELTWGTGLGVADLLAEDPDLRSVPVILFCSRIPSTLPPANVIEFDMDWPDPDQMLQIVHRVLQAPE